MAPLETPDVERLARPSTTTLDGYVLPVDAESWQIDEVDLRTLTRLATGAVREDLPLTEPDEPVDPVLRVFRLRWSNLGAARGLVERLLARPGVHHLVLWRREHLVYRGDGERTVFRWPRGWVPAADVVAPPEGLDVERFAPAVRLAPDADPLPSSAVDAATFEGGTPPAGEVWWQAGGARWALGSPPAAGAWIDAGVVPVYQVVREKRAPRRLELPVPEPYEVTLWETRGQEASP